jgi:hypothetical protein
MINPIAANPTLTSPQRLFPARAPEALPELVLEDVASLSGEKLAPQAPIAVQAPETQAPSTMPAETRLRPPVPSTLQEAGAAEAGPQVLGGRPKEVLFDGFLKVRTYELDIQRPEGVQTVTLTNLNGPGHNCAMVATTALAPDGTPRIILKKGDTRLSRQLRGEEYVKLGPTGGRLDKVGADPEKIGLSETAEELGGRPVEGSFRRLGSKLSPTMPHESTESDAYFSAVVQLGGKIEGDGGGMEAVGLIGPYLCDYQEFQRLLNSGEIADGARTRTMYGRNFDSVGYIPQLGVYVHDHPALKARFSTLGLGEPWDPRSQKPPEIQPEPPAEPDAPKNEAALIDHCIITQCKEIPLGIGMKMIDAQTQHAATVDGVVVPQEKKFLNQVECLNYDRAKMVVYYNDPQQGPMVYFADCERPLQALKGTGVFGQECDPTQDNTNLVRKDLMDFKIDREEAAGPQLANLLASELKVQSQPRELCAKTSTSSGSNDLYYHFYAVEVDKPPAGVQFVPLAQAVLGCRGGDADPLSESTLLSLYDQLGWIPQLGMSVESARQLIG